MMCPARRPVRLHPARVTATVILALGVAGCGSTTAETRDADPANTPPDLAGRWVSACVPNPQADGSTQYFQLTFNIESARWAVDYVVHGDAVCSVPLLTVQIAGPYLLESPSVAVAGAWEGRFGFDARTVRPEVDGLRDFLRGLEGCGDGAFETGVASDTLAVGCPGLGQYPAADCGEEFDIVRLEGDTLTFGARPADNNMCTAALRPTALSPVVNRRQ